MTNKYISCQREAKEKEVAAHFEALKHLCEQFLEELNHHRGTKIEFSPDMQMSKGFGAVEYFCAIHPELEIEIARWWNNEMREKFHE